MKKETKDFIYLLLFALVFSLVISSALYKMKNHGIDIKVPITFV